jgi:hypothetical protein
VRGDEDVAGEEGLEVYEGEGVGGCVEDLPGFLSLGVPLLVVVVVGFCLSYLGGYGEGPEFYELVCEGGHVFDPGCAFLAWGECTDVVSVSMESVAVEVGAAKSRASSDVTSPSLRQQHRGSQTPTLIYHSHLDYRIFHLLLEYMCITVEKSATVIERAYMYAAAVG